MRKTSYEEDDTHDYVSAGFCYVCKKAIITAIDPTLVPALHALFGSIDRAIGHHRRYARDEIVAKLRASGLAVEHVRYFNLLGAPGWFLNSRVFGRKQVPGLQARVHDRLVPLLRLEERWKQPPFGMSLLAVGRVLD